MIFLSLTICLSDFRSLLLGMHTPISVPDFLTFRTSRIVINGFTDCIALFKDYNPSAWIDPFFPDVLESECARDESHSRTIVVGNAAIFL